MINWKVLKQIIKDMMTAISKANKIVRLTPYKERFGVKVEIPDFKVDFAQMNIYYMDTRIAEIYAYPAVAGYKLKANYQNEQQLWEIIKGFESAIGNQLYPEEGLGWENILSERHTRDRYEMFNRVNNVNVNIPVSNISNTAQLISDAYEAMEKEDTYSFCHKFEKGERFYCLEYGLVEYNDTTTVFKIRSGDKARLIYIENKTLEKYMEKGYTLADYFKEYV